MAVKKEAPKKTAVAEATGRALQPWEQRMAELAKEAGESAASGAGSSKRIGTRGGVFTIDGNAVEGNVLRCVVLDFIFDVTYYLDGFDPDDISPPHCFALGRKETELVWDDASHPDYAGKDLKSSDIFQWNSADKGRGKAAKSRRRLLLIAEGDLEDVAAAEVRKLMIPVTSTDAWKTYVEQVRVHGRAPCGVLTEISIAPHPKYQFTLSFKMLGTVEDDAMLEILEKRESVQEELFTPYPAWDSVQEEPESTPSKARGAAARKPVPKGRR